MDDTQDTAEQPEKPSQGLASAALLMVVVTFGSAVIGAVRTVLFAWRFGAEGAPNAFIQASRIPDLVYFLIAGGALRAGFVPVFAQMWASGRRDEAWRSFSALFWTLVLIGGAIVGLGMVFSPQLSVLVGPGWVREHPDLLPLTSRLMRLMFPAQLFFVVGGLLMGTLNARHEFLWPGLGPIIYNLVVVAAIAAATGPEDLWLVALTVPVGAAIGNVLIQLPSLGRVGGRLELYLSLRDEGLRKTFLLAGPVIFGLAIAELNFLITTVLATYVEPTRGPTSLMYANLLWRAPTRIIGGGIGIALFTSLAYHFAEGTADRFRRDLVFATRTTIFMALPLTIILMILRRPIVALLYQHGSFDAMATEYVAATLLAYAFGIIPLSVYYLVARAFYARHDTRTPVVVGAGSFVFCAASGYVLMHLVGVAGLALANALAAAVNTAALWYILARRMGGIGTFHVLRMTRELSIPTAALVVACMVGAHLTSGPGPVTIKDCLLALAVGVGVGGGAYLALAHLVRLEELQMAIRALRRHQGRRDNNQASAPLET
ncbi:MAG: murein biosynthesis integral membrane protein MurJ [Armatimonadetes bacterium]|nr:murein biosynthesis integral membrane protein MurJ [Armatimonadota bacterium]